jgi:hypothetical protein
VPVFVHTRPVPGSMLVSTVCDVKIHSPMVTVAAARSVGAGRDAIQGWAAMPYCSIRHDRSQSLHQALIRATAVSRSSTHVVVDARRPARQRPVLDVLTAALLTY